MITTDERVDDFLEHFGVKGMHWGHRSASSQQIRDLNKTIRKRQNQEFGRSVDRARIRRKSGDIRKDWKASKTQFHQDKINLGSKEARKIMNKKKIKLNEEYYTSKSYKNGKEIAGAILITVGGFVALHSVGKLIDKAIGKR